MRGRKPKPTALKVIAGNPGKRRLNENEPKPASALQHAPDWFDEEQLKLWRYAVNHAPDGVLGTIDREVLAIWVVASAMHSSAAQLQSQVDAKNSMKMLTKTPNGMAVQSPYISIMNKQAQIMLKAAAEMGFTPSSRSRISVPRSEDEGNAFAGF